MNSKTKILLMILLVVLPGISLFAQSDDESGDVEYSNDGKGWAFGLNIGFYYPSKGTAEYYNGRSYNVNNADYVMDNYYWYQDIFHALGATDTVFIAGLPDNMHYTPAMQPGIYAQYNFNPTLALMIEFNYMRLKAKDVITFEVDPIPTVNTNPDLRLYTIYGQEERVYADIGLKRTYPKSEKFSYFVNGGLNLNSITVKKSAFFVEEVEYSMINNYGNNYYIPGGNNQTYNVYQGGIGVGMFAGGGVAFTFNKGIVVESGINAHWLMVKLERYQNMNPGIGAYIRFLL
jgi:hypothetical protein